MYLLLKLQNNYFSNLSKIAAMALAISFFFISDIKQV